MSSDSIGPGPYRADFGSVSGVIGPASGLLGSAAASVDRQTSRPAEWSVRCAVVWSVSGKWSVRCTSYGAGVVRRPARPGPASSLGQPAASVSGQQRQRETGRVGRPPSRREELLRRPAKLSRCSGGNTGRTNGQWTVEGGLWIVDCGRWTWTVVREVWVIHGAGRQC